MPPLKTPLGLVVAVVVMTCSGTVLAQATAPIVTYRLGPGSTFERGCVAPCSCAYRAPIPIRGTFNLTRQTVGPLYTDYTVTNVAWQMVDTTASNAASQTIKITGSGTYRVGGEVAVTQQLMLDLVVDGGAVQHFDSGVVAGGSQFPAIDISVLATTPPCLTTTIHVNAKPLPAPPSVPYSLSKASTYQHGCFDPCACPVSEVRPIGGGFMLTPTPSTSSNLFATYAVSQVDWITVEPGTGTTTPIHITGAGTYRISVGSTTPSHELVLDLSVDGAKPIHLDSGLVPGGGDFPAMEIQISTDPSQCVRTVIVVQARPSGDFDLDGSVTSVDVAHFESCVTGPGVAQLNASCRDTDLNGDGVVDMVDFGALQRCITGDDAMDVSGCAD